MLFAMPPLLTDFRLIFAAAACVAASRYAIALASAKILPLPFRDFAASDAIAVATLTMLATPLPSGYFMSRLLPILLLPIRLKPTTSIDAPRRASMFALYSERVMRRAQARGGEDRGSGAARRVVARCAEQATLARAMMAARAMACARSTAIAARTCGARISPLRLLRQPSSIGAAAVILPAFRDAKQSAPRMRYARLTRRLPRCCYAARYNDAAFAIADMRRSVCGVLMPHAARHVDARRKRARCCPSAFTFDTLAPITRIRAPDSAFHAASCY